MAIIPDDIFTEPEEVDPDTLANLGPLTRLAGTWESADGRDINPKADGPSIAITSSGRSSSRSIRRQTAPSFSTASATTRG